MVLVELYLDLMVRVSQAMFLMWLMDHKGDRFIFPTLIF